jgi:LAS superfamily LD-carboxypeptidase LdcB
MQSNFYRNQVRIVTLVSIAALVSVTSLLSGCATTINESAPTTLADNVVTETTTLTVDQQLSTEELLTQMLTTVNALSEAMQKSDRQTASKKVDQILLISNAVRPKILTLSDQLAADFDRVIALAKSSVERNRPADADKALRFLPLIIDSLDNF